MAKVFKVERKTSSGYWYEVMLSPFLLVRDAGKYIDKYKQYYPPEDQSFRVLDHEVDRQTYRRLKSFFSRVSDY